MLVKKSNFYVTKMHGTTIKIYTYFDMARNRVVILVKALLSV